MGKAKGSAPGLHGWILPAKYSGYRSPRPVALIAYHMEKTGGSALMKWLHKHVRPEQPRLTSLFDYAHTFCFFGLYPDIFPTWSKHWEERCAPGAPALVPWQTSAVAVEFHAYNKRRFWESLEPMLPQLRQKYRERNGSLVTFTLIRDPAAHILSTYRMWPPQLGSGADKHAKPLVQWLRVASGLQVATLCIRVRNRRTLGYHNPEGCSSMLNESRRRLTIFDVAGPMACMRSVFRGLSHLMGWDTHDALAEERMDHALHQSLTATRPSGARVGGVLWHEARAFSAVDSMNQSVRDALREAARCDMHLYIDALRRTRLLIQQFSRDHADRQALDGCAETELRNALTEHE
jgi:hypothetical protein